MNGLTSFPLSRLLPAGGSYLLSTLCCEDIAKMSSDETGVSSVLAGIQKLKGVVNYQDWKFQVRNYLEHRNLWSAVKPAISTAGLEEIVMADKDRRARTSICMLLEPICFAKVRTATTAKQAWTKLKEAYEDKGWGRKLRLQQSLWNCKLETCSSMDDYVTKVMDYHISYKMSMSKSVTSGRYGYFSVDCMRVMSHL
jgi:hypothetical protein